MVSLQCGLCVLVVSTLHPKGVRFDPLLGHKDCTFGQITFFHAFFSTQEYK